MEIGLILGGLGLFVCCLIVVLVFLFISHGRIGDNDTIVDNDNKTYNLTTFIVSIILLIFGVTIGLIIRSKVPKYKTSAIVFISLVSLLLTVSLVIGIINFVNDDAQKFKMNNLIQAISIIATILSVIGYFIYIVVTNRPKVTSPSPNNYTNLPQNKGLVKDKPPGNANAFGRRKRSYGKRAKKYRK